MTLTSNESKELHQQFLRSSHGHPGIDAESHIYAGKRQEEILLAAKDYGASCIVMGSSYKPALKRIFKGSCLYDVAEGSGVPIIVVP